MKEFFSWYRKQMGGKLTQSQVDDANALIDKMGIEQAKILLAKTKPNTAHMALSDKGFDMIATFEGFRPKPYLDAVGVPTIGYGNTYYLDGRKVKMTDKPISRDEAKRLKMAVINKDFAPAVRKALADSKVPIAQNMFDACVSLAYNIGVSAFAKSSVVRYLNAGNKQKAGDAFLMWNKAGGMVLDGLARRRKREREVFLA